MVRFPPNWSMELLLCVALFAAVVVLVFSIRPESGDRTRFTLERSELAYTVRERNAPPFVEETSLGR